MAKSPTLHARDKLTLISNLGTMLSSGIPILEAVDTLLEENKGAPRAVLQLMRKGLEQGQPISQAMRKAPKAFDPVTINIVRAAEEAGTLEEALRDLQTNIKSDIAFTDRLRSSMVYPGFVILIFFGVLTMILTFVVPRISKVFIGLRLDLPPTTKALIATSDFVLAFWPYIIAAIIAIIVLVIFLFKTRRRQIVNALLNLPLLNNIGRLIDLARFTRSMTLLLKSGLPVAEALELSKGVVVKKEIEDAVISMQKSVEDGKSMADGLKAHKNIIPPVMLRILQTAELSGTLEKTMQELAEYFDEQVSRVLKNLTELIEPILIVVIGLLVGGMMLAIIAPIYGIISQINTR